MMRRIIDWLLYLLHIKKKEYKPPLQTLMDLLPIAYASAVVIGILGRSSRPQIALRRRLFWNFKHALRRWRKVLIGY